MSIDNLYSPEEIEALKAQASTPEGRRGQTIGDVVREQGRSSAAQAPDITQRAQKVTRPSIQGAGAYVTRPNLDKHMAAHEARVKAEAKARDEYVSPAEAQEKQIAYLTRAVQKLQKELKALKDV